MYIRGSGGGDDDNNMSDKITQTKKKDYGAQEDATQRRRPIRLV